MKTTEESAKSFDLSKRWRFVVPMVQQFLAWPPTCMVFWLFTKMKVYGFEHVRNLEGPIIFAPNHSGEFDPILIRAALPWLSKFSPMFYVVAADKEYKQPKFKWRKHLYGGFFFRSWGAYPVISNMKDYSKAMPYHEQILNHGGTVCMFPEGHWTHSGAHTTARGGIAYLAEATGATIIPTTISGTFRMKSKDFFRGKVHVTVTFSEPMRASDIIDNTLGVPEKYQKAAKYIMDINRAKIVTANE